MPASRARLELAAAGLSCASGIVTIVGAVVGAVHAVSFTNASLALLQVDGGKCAALAERSARTAVGNTSAAVRLVEPGLAPVICSIVAVAVAIARVAVGHADACVAAR